ncbi:MAG: hypothetical protein C0594_03620, partial [Marinilabiliales bacterium]
SLANAHPAKKVEISWNKEKSELTIIAEHPVKDVKTHFIDEIVIEVNGEEVAKIEVKEQTGKEQEKLVKSLENIKSGDVIKVTTSCNKFGKKSAEITIE